MLIVILSFILSFLCFLSLSLFFLSFFPLLSSEHALLKEQWPEGAQAVTEVTKRPKSAGTRFKVQNYTNVIALV